MKYSNGKIIYEVHMSDSKKLKLRHIKGNINFKSVKGLCIFLYESLELYIKMQNIITRLNGYDGNLLIAHVDQATAEEIRSVQKFDGTEYRFTLHPKLHFIVNADRRFIDLITIVMFTPRACHEVQTTTINRYSKQVMAWEQQLERLTNDINFHSCTLCFYFRDEIKGGKLITNANGTLTLEGALMEIFKEIAKYLNVKIELVDRNQYKNFSCDAIYIRPLSWTDPSVSPFYLNELYFIVPQGEQLSELDILLLAFDAATWHLIIATFGTAFVVIFIIQISGITALRNFVFGRNVSTPALNVLIAFFGLGQIVLPSRNFARFLLTLFIIWSLIIRTCYNGLLFEYLQSDKHHPGIETIDELFKRNFTYFASLDFFELIEQESDLFIKVRNSFSKVVDEYFMAQAFGTKWQDVLNAYFEAPRNESILIADTFQIIDFHKKNPNQTLLIMKETIVSFYGGIRLISQYFSPAIIKKAIANLTENGIISHELSEMNESKFFNPQPEPKEPEVLTLSQLAVGFKLYGYCLGLIFVVLFAEFVVFKVRKALMLRRA